MMFTDEEKSILLKAADEIDRRGLWKGAFSSQLANSPAFGLAIDDTCQFCASGALNYVTTGDPGVVPLQVKLIREKIDYRLTPGNSNLPEFNDAEATTKDDVVNFLRKIAS